MFLLFFNARKHIQELLHNSHPLKHFFHSYTCEYSEMSEVFEEDTWCILTKNNLSVTMTELQKNFKPKLSIKTLVSVSKFRSYWKLSELFIETRFEERRDPTESEFWGFLQFDKSYDWRNPNKKQARQLAKWANGFKEKRLDAKIFKRARWLADQRCIARTPNYFSNENNDVMLVNNHTRRRGERVSL